MNTILTLVLAVTLSDSETRQTLVVVVGAGGSPQYQRHFDVWAGRWVEAGKRAEAEVVVIGRVVDENNSPAGNDRERLRRALLHPSQNRESELWLVLIGHGTFDRRRAKFNLRGPDVSAGELGNWLGHVKRPLAIVNCSSASGPFLGRLSTPGRVVVTATRSGYQHNFARFGDHLSQAIAGDDADLDKDGQTSLLEAFLSATRKLKEQYEREARLATEHGLIDDNGDGQGTPASWFRGIRAVRKPVDGAADGPAAHQFHLVRSEREQALPLELRRRRNEIELAVAQLRERKKELTEDDYYRRLQELLVPLAELYEPAD